MEVEEATYVVSHRFNSIDFVEMGSRWSITCLDMGDKGLSRFIACIMGISWLPRAKVVGLSGAGTLFVVSLRSGASCVSIDSWIGCRGGPSKASIFPFISASLSSCSSCSTGGPGWQIAAAASSSSAFSITIGSWRDARCVIASAARNWACG